MNTFILGLRLLSDRPAPRQPGVCGVLGGEAGSRAVARQKWQRRDHRTRHPADPAIHRVHGEFTKRSCEVRDGDFGGRTRLPSFMGLCPRAAVGRAARFKSGEFGHGDKVHPHPRTP